MVRKFAPLFLVLILLTVSVPASATAPDSFWAPADPIVVPAEALNPPEPIMWGAESPVSAEVTYDYQAPDRLRLDVVVKLRDGFDNVSLTLTNTGGVTAPSYEDQSRFTSHLDQGRHKAHFKFRLAPGESSSYELAFAGESATSIANIRHAIDADWFLLSHHIKVSLMTSASGETDTYPDDPSATTDQISEEDYTAESEAVSLIHLAEDILGVERPAPTIPPVINNGSVDPEQLPPVPPSMSMAASSPISLVGEQLALQGVLGQTPTMPSVEDVSAQATGSLEQVAPVNVLPADLGNLGQWLTEQNGLPQPTSSESAAAAAITATATVTGTIRFKDPTSSSTSPVYYNCRFCRVEVYEADAPTYYSNLLATVNTDSNGNFIASINNADESGTADVALIVRAQGAVVNVQRTTGTMHYMPAGQLYTNCPTTCALGIRQWVLSGETEAAFWMHEGSVRGWSYIQSQGGSIVPAATILYPVDGTTQCSQATTANTAFYCGGTTRRISIGSNQDLAMNVMIHEYGHYAMHWAYGWTNPTAACPNPHMVDAVHNTGCAWSEGWASYLSIAVLNNHIFTHANGAQTRYETFTAPTRNDSVEGCVTATLWDLDDGGTETGDTINFSFNNIWTTLDSRNDGTFNAYYQSWGLKGFSQANFRTVAALNGIVYT